MRNIHIAVLTVLAACVLVLLGARQAATAKAERERAEAEAVRGLPTESSLRDGLMGKTPDEVRDRLGEPDDVQAGGTALIWTYRRPVAREWSPVRHVGVHFKIGRVYMVSP